MAELWSVILVLAGSLLGSFGSLYFKVGSEKISRTFKKNFHNYPLFKGAFFYLLSSILYITALRGGQLSFLYPLVSTTFIWTSLLSIKFLQEKMNKEKWLGIFLIILGISFIGLGG